MFTALAQFAASETLPFSVLLMGCIVVVVEAARASRHALWGDMFSDDQED